MRKKNTLLFGFYCIESHSWYFTNYIKRRHILSTLENAVYLENLFKNAFECKNRPKRPNINGLLVQKKNGCRDVSCENDIYLDVPWQNELLSLSLTYTYTIAPLTHRTHTYECGSHVNWWKASNATPEETEAFLCCVVLLLSLLHPSAIFILSVKSNHSILRRLSYFAASSLALTEDQCRL